MATTLTIDSFTFQNWELPNDIDGFGVVDKQAVHDCPGAPGQPGVRIVQSFGQFPKEQISWSGNLMQDPDIGEPSDRVRALKKLADGQPHSLAFGDFGYLVYIHEVHFKPCQESWFPYTITIIPVLDQALSTSAPGVIPAPSSGASTSTLAGQAAGLGQSQWSSGAGALPASVQNSLTNFQAALKQALSAAQNNTANISAGPLLAQIAALQTQLAPLANGNSAAAVSAFQASSVLSNVGTTLTPSTQPLAVLKTVNPDLKQLALQWYRDPSLWPVISKANKLPPTPRFYDGPRDITIPPLPVSNAS